MAILKYLNSVFKFSNFKILHSYIRVSYKKVKYRLKLNTYITKLSVIKTKKYFDAVSVCILLYYVPKIFKHNNVT